MLGVSGLQCMLAHTGIKSVYLVVDSFQHKIVIYFSFPPLSHCSEDLKIYAQRKRQGAEVPEDKPVRDLLTEMQRKLSHIGDSLRHEELALTQDLSIGECFHFIFTYMYLSSAL